MSRINFLLWLRDIRIIWISCKCRIQFMHRRISSDSGPSSGFELFQTNIVNPPNLCLRRFSTLKINGFQRFDFATKAHTSHWLSGWTLRESTIGQVLPTLLRKSTIDIKNNRNMFVNGLITLEENVRNKLRLGLNKRPFRRNISV